MMSLVHLNVLSLICVLYLIKSVDGQEDLPWDQCRNVTTGTFCLGAKEKISAKAGEGCFKNDDCEAWVVGVINGENIKWQLMILVDEPPNIGSKVHNVLFWADSECFSDSFGPRYPPDAPIIRFRNNTFCVFMPASYLYDGCSPDDFPYKGPATGVTVGNYHMATFESPLAMMLKGKDASQGPDWAGVDFKNNASYAYLSHYYSVVTGKGEIRRPRSVNYAISDEVAIYIFNNRPDGVPDPKEPVNPATPRDPAKAPKKDFPLWAIILVAVVGFLLFAVIVYVVYRATASPVDETILQQPPQNQSVSITSNLPQS